MASSRFNARGKVQPTPPVCKERPKPSTTMQQSTCPTGPFAPPLLHYVGDRLLAPDGAPPPVHNQLQLIYQSDHATWRASGFDGAGNALEIVFSFPCGGTEWAIGIYYPTEAGATLYWTDGNETYAYGSPLEIPTKQASYASNFEPTWLTYSISI